MSAITAMLCQEKKFMRLLSRGVLDVDKHMPTPIMKDLGIHEVTKYVIGPTPHQPYSSVNHMTYKGT